MAAGTEPTIPSGSMEATPALADTSHDDLPPVPALATTLDREPDPEQMSLARRIRQPRTIISIADIPGPTARSRKAAMRSPSAVLISSPTITVSPSGASSRAATAPSIRS